MSLFGIVRTPSRMKERMQERMQEEERETTTVVTTMRNVSLKSSTSLFASPLELNQTLKRPPALVHISSSPTTENLGESFVFLLFSSFLLSLFSAILYIFLVELWVQLKLTCLFSFVRWVTLFLFLFLFSRITRSIPTT